MEQPGGRGIVLPGCALLLVRRTLLRRSRRLKIVDKGEVPPDCLAAFRGIAGKGSFQNCLMLFDDSLAETVILHQAGQLLPVAVEKRVQGLLHER